MAFDEVVGLQVTDEAGYARYRQGMLPILEEYGGSFRDDFRIAEHLRSEASHPINRLFLIAFPDREQRDSAVGPSRVHVAFHPIVRRPFRVLLDRLSVRCLGAIELRAAQAAAFEPEDCRAVGIAVSLAKRVMLAVHRDPLSRAGARVDPEPGTEEMAQGGVQVDRTVRLVAMVVERDAEQRHVHADERDCDVAPRAQIGQSMVVIEQEFHDLIPDVRS